MERFAFVIHPIDIGDLARKFGVVGKLPPRLLEALARLAPPLRVSHITGVRSAAGAEAEGWFVGCTLSARQMLQLPQSFVLGRITQAGRLAQELGAGIVGLGAFTSVVGDAGITVARGVDIPVTTGNSYTVATALEGVGYAAAAMGIALAGAEVVVLGASGSIGKACARILAPQVGGITLVARDAPRLADLAGLIQEEAGRKAAITTDVAGAVRGADVVVAVTSALEAIIQPLDLKAGAIVCDVARPRNVSKLVQAARDDVLVFEGGLVEVPGEVDFGFDFGFPARTAYACMAETMVLALSGRYEPFSLGRDLAVEQVREIAELAAGHGFRLAGLRSFERAVGAEEIARVRERAAERAKTSRSVV